MNLINKLLCKIFGHKWKKRLKGRLCERCNTFEKYYEVNNV